MTDLIRRFRGLGVALVVLALSAGVVFAGAPRISPVANSEPTVEEPSGEAGETDAPESQEPSDDASDEASDDASESAEPSEDASDAADASQGAHGALVSTAANMDTPPGFPNHGAFVSCVAHMDKGVLVEGFDWATVTPESCGITPGDKATKAEKGKAKAEAAKAKGQAGRAHGKEKSGR